MSETPSPSNRVQRLAWLVWIAVGVAMSALSASGDKHTVTGAYRSGTIHWFAGEQLYEMDGWGFIYAPQMAIVIAPCGLR